MTDQKVNAGTRLVSMVLDHVIMTFAAMIFAIPGMISSFATAFDISHEQTSFDPFGNMSYVMLIGLAIYFCKDSINGQSPAKRILKFQVIDNSSGTAASPLKCFVRNIFCIIWPIEVIIALVNPSRRLGDIVAGTKVIQFDPAAKQHETNWGQIGLALVLAYGLMLAFMIPVNRMTSNISSQKVNYLEGSYNEHDSKSMEQIFTDSLGNHLTADIRVYDKIENEDLKYVSVILRLKENYLADEESFQQLKSSTMSLVLSRFPEKTFVGRLLYVYQSGGSIQSRTLPIDWRETSTNE